MSNLINQPTKQPTRKVNAATGAAALAGAITAMISSVAPMGGLEPAISTIVEALVGGALIGISTFVAGYFVRERSS